MSSWEERAALLQCESRKFQQYLGELPDEAWQKQSACDPEGRPAAGTGHPSKGAAGTAEGAIANRERLGAGLQASLEARTNHLTQLLSGLSPEERDKPCYHPGGIVPAFLIQCPGTMMRFLLHARYVGRNQGSLPGSGVFRALTVFISSPRLPGSMSSRRAGHS